MSIYPILAATEEVSNFFQSVLSFFTEGGGFMILLIVGMLLLMIIPNRRREKKVKQMLEALKPGDRIRTIGGIYGTITSVRDDVITIAVGPDKLRMVIARGAVATIEDSEVENTMDSEIATK
ncbi:MAG: preprotein translocase subunit YajC [Clostridia bacterium]|nr:preprotein translocase subunit YajC [Clostridia bacterium]